MDGKRAGLGWGEGRGGKKRSGVRERGYSVGYG
jgi:hypothetical protein